MWAEAIERAAEKTKRNIAGFGEQFPNMTDEGPQFKLSLEALSRLSSDNKEYWYE